MLYLVPLARAGWQMGYGNCQAGLVGETLELALPQAHPVAVAAAAIGGNDKGCGLGIACFAEAIPPAANTLDCEGRGVGVDADIDPALVGGDVVDAIEMLWGERRGKGTIVAGNQPTGVPHAAAE
jgi:hypothetical protein